MKIIKLSAMAASVFAASLLAPQISSAADDMHRPGAGWDVFNARSGEPLPSYNQSYMGTSMMSAPGQGWDVFHNGAEGTVPVTTSLEGTAMTTRTGGGWDVFHTGIGDPI